MESTILQYEISDWSQLTQCQSNNSPDLNISVCKFIQNPDIEGIRVSVNHPIYGVLFSYTISPAGSLITDITCKDVPVMTSQILLNELSRYGFYIDYVEEANLSDKQVEFLNGLSLLGYDKIRLCSVYDGTDSLNNTLYVTLFKVEAHPNWLNSGYSPSRKEWNDAILAGTAFNASGLSDAIEFRWDWLYNVVYDLNDVLKWYEV